MLLYLLWNIPNVQADPTSLYQAYQWETLPNILICPDSTLTKKMRTNHLLLEWRNW